MKVALARPNYYTHLITPPLGIGYLCAYLRTHDVPAFVVDGLNRGLSNDEIVGACAEADLIGISCLSDFWPETADLVAKLKRAGKRVVVGGPHASALPAAVLEQSDADFVIVGEGEETLLDLVRALETGGSTAGLPGLVSGAAQDAERRPLIADIDSIPFPTWSEMDPRQYRKAPHGALIQSFPVGPITSSRGCPFQCTFCASPFLWGKHIRFRSTGNVVDEIEYLTKEFGVREIHFEDDNLTLRRSHVEGICEDILRRGIRVSWAAPNGIRVGTVTRDLLRLMKRSGCYYLAFGVESGSQEILDGIRKGVDLGEIERTVRMASAEGIMTQGFFIFGLPGETSETIEETIRFAKRIPLDRAQFLMLDVLPGTALWDEVSPEAETDWTSRSYQDVKWTPPGLTREELQRAPGRAFRSFFLRPRQILGLLRYIRLSQIPFVVQRLRDFRIWPAGRRTAEA